MNSLQKPAEASLHWQSRYNGEGGALETSRRTYERARGCYMQALARGSSGKVQERRRALAQRKSASHISTLCSAIGPAFKKLRPFEGFALLRELRLALFRLPYIGYDGLSPTEMEVTIAGLTKAWVFPPEWVSGDVGFLSRRILSNPRITLSTRLLTYARLQASPLPSTEFSDLDILSMRGHVAFAVTKTFIDGLYGDLEWSTVARIAKMIGMKDAMHQAAINDGSPDVLIKYGPFFASWRARLKTWRT